MGQKRGDISKAPISGITQVAHPLTCKKEGIFEGIFEGILGG